MTQLQSRFRFNQFLSDLLTLEQSMVYYPLSEEHADVRVRELEAKLEGR